MRQMTVKLLIVAVIGTSAMAYADQDAIDYRQHVMSTLGDQVSIIGMILEGRAPADNFASHVEILAMTAATARDAFEPEAPGGDAKPEIWTEWPDFAQRLDELAAATSELAKLAQEGGVAAAAPKIKDALNCRSCHENYRIPD